MHNPEESEGEFEGLHIRSGIEYRKTLMHVNTNIKINKYKMERFEENKDQI